MSADNWAKCPSCRKEKEISIEARKKNLESFYGKIPGETYVQRSQDLAKELEQELSTTLREDYDIGIDIDGEFMVEYRAKCDICNFKYNFNTKEQVWRQN